MKKHLPPAGAPAKPAPSTTAPVKEMPIGGGPPPGVGTIKLNYLLVQPTSVKGGETVTVSWSATVPKDVPAGFYLAGDPVPAVGRRSFQPLSTTSYCLSAYSFGQYILFGCPTVTVDSSDCATPGKTLPVDEIAAGIEATLYGMYQSGSNLTVADGLITIWQAEFDDATFAFDPATGWLELTLTLQATIEGIEGQGSLTTNVWMSLEALGGQVITVLQNSQTSLNLPWGVWLLALADPALVATITAALYAIGPGMISSYVSGKTGGIGDFIKGLFPGGLISSVSIQMVSDAAQDPPVATIVTTVCSGSNHNL